MKDKLNDYLTTLRESTQKTYKSHLNRYFRTMKKNPNTYINKSIKEIEKDMLIFINKNENTPPKTTYTMIEAIKGYLRDNDIELTPSGKQRIKNKMKKARAITLDEVPTRQQLKEILQHGMLKDRALFLFASSSGMRIREILQLTNKNINTDTEPPTIEIQASITKANYPRITFITQEAKEALIEWLKERPKYIITKRHRGKPLRRHKISNENAIFPFTYETARRMWIRLITKAGYSKRDLSTERYKYHIHGLRKYFITQATPHINKQMLDYMTGHIDSLTRTYMRPTIEQLKEEYLKLVEHISIFGTPTDITGLQEQLKYLQNENQELKQQLHTLDKKQDNFMSWLMKDMNIREKPKILDQRPLNLMENSGAIKTKKKTKKAIITSTEDEE